MMTASKGEASVASTSASSARSTASDSGRREKLWLACVAVWPPAACIILTSVSSRKGRQLLSLAGRHTMLARMASVERGATALMSAISSQAWLRAVAAAVSSSLLLSNRLA